MIKAELLDKDSVNIVVEGTGGDILREYIAVSRMIADNLRGFGMSEEGIIDVLTACAAVSLDENLLSQHDVTETDLTDLLKAAMKEFEK